MAEDGVEMLQSRIREPPISDATLSASWRASQFGLNGSPASLR
jgi:hypothetical protein